MNIRIRARVALVTFVVVAMAAQAAAQTELRLTSPDARTAIDVAIHDGHMMYSVLRDGKPRKAIGITEYLAPKNMKYRLFRWFMDLRIGKNGKGSIL